MRALRCLLFMGALLFKGSDGSEDEKRLLDDLLRNYNVMVIPVKNSSDGLDMRFGISMIQIQEVDEEDQVLISSVWQKLMWKDYQLAWNESEYGGITNIRIPTDKIWYPDILLYNSAGREPPTPSLAVLSSDGNLLHIPPQIVESICKMDLTWFPFDEQRCKIKYGSWTRDGLQLNLTLDSETADTTDFRTNPRWELIGVPAKRTVKYYSCCSEPYIDLTYEVILKRRPFAPATNVVGFLLLVSFLSVLGFAMPAQGQGKLIMQLSLIFATTVMNSTYHEYVMLNNQITLLGCYVSRIFLSVLFALIATIMIINIHHRKNKMSSQSRKVFLGWVAFVVGLGQTGKKVADSKPDIFTTTMEKIPDNNLQIGTSTDPLFQEGAEWQVAARVLDRFCLFVFGFVNLVFFAAFCLTMPA